MKRTLILFSLFAVICSHPAHAACSYLPYVKLGSGISCSQSAKVVASPPTWDAAEQGYNSTLGNCAIADLALGCELMRFFDVEVSISNRSTFKYRKFQTSISSGDSYTREFDLDVTPVLFSVNLLGREVSCLNWNIGCGSLYPVIGGGVGVSNLLITNFRTTGLPPSGDSAPFASFSAENQYTRRRNFTYTGLVGLEYNYKDSWALSTGYRWFDAGTFKGPRYQRVATGAAVDLNGEEWKMRFRANEWFVEFKVFL